MADHDRARRSDRALVSDQAAPRLDPPGFDPSRSDVEFLLEVARYFERRPTGGEDRAHWANVYNAEHCRRIAEWLSHLENVKAVYHATGIRTVTTKPFDWYVIGPDGEVAYCQIGGQAHAEMIAAALNDRVAMCRLPHPRDSDGSPKGGDGEAGSVHDSAAIAQPSAEV